MPEPTDEELGLDSQQMEGLDQNIRRELRQARITARDAATATERNVQLERELALTKAGIPDNPLGQMFTKAYDGPTDDPTAIKSAFEALGVPVVTPSGDPNAQSPPEPQSAPGNDPEVERLRQLAQVGNTGDATGGTVEFNDALASAESPEALMALLDTEAAGKAGIGRPQIQ